VKTEEALIAQAFEGLRAYFHQDATDHDEALSEWFQSLSSAEQSAVRSVLENEDSGPSLSSRWRQAKTGWRFSQKKLKLMFSKLAT
jgi:hypothetical protein